MSEQMKIMVAVDFGGSSDRAFAAALDLAARLGAALELVHVVPLLPEITAKGVPNPTLDDARSALACYEADAAARKVQARSHVEEEVAVFALMNAIARLKPAFVFVGSHGRTGVARALLGSVSDALCRKSPVPVVVVPAPEREANAVALACAACGHLRRELESTVRCGGCGVEPVEWLSAEVKPGPIDADLPKVADAHAEGIEREGSGEPAQLFATAPGGSGRVSINPELRVRY